MNEQRLKTIEKDILLIKARNSKVEADKSWETSWFRRLVICGIIYLLIAATFYLIGIENFLANALVPTVGFLLSTLTLPVIKNWWLKNRYQS